MPELFAEVAGNSFPFFVHIITIPMTFGFGFLVGWILRAAVGKRAARRPGRTLSPSS